jgi:hypothetical protein
MDVRPRKYCGQFFVSRIRRPYKNVIPYRRRAEGKRVYKKTYEQHHEEVATADQREGRKDETWGIGDGLISEKAVEAGARGAARGRQN